MEKETRAINVEYRIVQEGDAPPKIAGYAAVFNRESEDLGGFVEVISRGAFKKALKQSDVRALFNHDSNYVLGRQSAGTLTLKEDKDGLFMEIDPPDTQFARDLMVSIKRGDINQQSFSFTISEGGDVWEEQKNRVLRTINEVREIYDVSPVTYPAYPDTSVAIRSLESIRNKTELEQRRKDEERLRVAKIESLKLE